MVQFTFLEYKNFWTLILNDIILFFPELPQEGVKLHSHNMVPELSTI